MKYRSFACGTIALSLLSYGILIGRYEVPPFGWFRAVARAFKVPVDPRQQRSAQYVSRLSFFSALPGQARVVMLGDSITEFGDWRELFPGASILNRGIIGDTSDGVIARLDEVIRRKPEIVFLMIGINDLLFDVDTQVIAQNIKTIAASLRNHGAQTIIEAILFVSDNPAINRKIARINAELHQWCLDNTISFVDLNTELAPNGRLLEGFTWDGIHLNGTAYLRWRGVIAPYIVR